MEGRAHDPPRISALRLYGSASEGIRGRNRAIYQEYLGFLKNNGWQVTFSKEMAARIALMYAECERGRE